MQNFEAYFNFSSIPFQVDDCEYARLQPSVCKFMENENCNNYKSLSKDWLYYML